MPHSLAWLHERRRLESAIGRGPGVLHNTCYNERRATAQVIALINSARRLGPPRHAWKNICIVPNLWMKWMFGSAGYSPQPASQLSVSQAQQQQKSAVTRSAVHLVPSATPLRAEL